MGENNVLFIIFKVRKSKMENELAYKINFVIEDKQKVEEDHC